MLVLKKFTHDVLLLQARPRNIPLAVVQAGALHQLAAQNFHICVAEDRLDLFETVIVEIRGDPEGWRWRSSSIIESR